jgi:hypothetical protein
MFKKQEPWEQTIKAVKAFFDKKGIRYTENGKRLNMRYDANNYNDQNFTLIFDDDGDSVALRAFSILKYTSAQIEQAHAQCNKQNCDYRWARFYVDNDNELTLAVDAVIRVIYRRRKLVQEPQIEELCERENCRCGEHFAMSALRHTVKITVFILIFSFALNLVIHGVGEEKLAALVLNRPILGNLLAGAVGLIPNCASSILLTELYLGGVISVGAMLSGLLVNAGVALVLLFRNNRPITDSVRVLVLLLGIGVLVGILIDVTPLAAFLSI